MERSHFLNIIHPTFGFVCDLHLLFGPTSLYTILLLLLLALQLPEHCRTTDVQLLRRN
jgi:hypothetical protein